MIHTYSNSDDFCSPPTARLDRSAVNGILVTPDDLHDPQKTSSSGSKSLYVKPLVFDHRDVRIHTSDSRTSPTPPSTRTLKIEYATQQPRLTEDSVPLGGLHDPYRRPNSRDANRGNMRTASPAFARINRTSFKRNSAIRRSLGGMAVPPSWLNDDPMLPFERVDRPNTDQAFQSATSAPMSTRSRLPSSSLDLAPLLHIRVVRLPSLDDLGFALDSYSHPHTGQFLGLRLCDRFQSRKFHFDARDNCPFEPGDLIVSVNQHRLSSMHESQAIRYVYNAFRDARQYTVEFGVFRLAATPDEASESRTAAKSYHEPSTLPTRSSHVKRYSAAYLLEPSVTSDPKVIEVNQHQPRRSMTPKSPTTLEPHLHPPSPHRPDRLEVPSSRPSTIEESSGTPTLSADPRSGGSQLTSTSTTRRSQRSGVPGKPPRFEGESTVRSPTGFSNSVRAKASVQSRLVSPGSPSNYRRSFSGIALKDLNAFNTRTIGQRIPIKLTKLADGGLGFTLTRRDTQTNSPGNDPVYVKKILPTGAAIRDGRLLVGDRLLTVDGVEVCNLDQVLTQLRSVLPGQRVSLVVSRQTAALSEEAFSGRKSALSSISQSPEEPDQNSVDLPSRPYRSFTFEFRLPRPTSRVSEKPTLGVNFKWATCPPGCDEFQSTNYAPLPGLYVESLLPDGIVVQSEQATLQPGDRLVGLNGDSLEGLSAKAIALKIKKVLVGNADSQAERPPSGEASILSTGRFSLTVHRYSGLKRHSITRHRTSLLIEDTRSPTKPDGSDYANVPLLADTRRRRSSFHGSPPDSSFTSVASGGAGSEELWPSGGSPRHLSVPPRILGGSNPYFEREGFGRRSVSEKRHAHVDAAQYPFFQNQILPSRYKMPEDVDKQYSTMPTTRRLKIHRERMAALAASTASGASGTGPVKALHPSADLGRPIDPGPYASHSAQSSSDHSNRDESTSARDPSASLFRRGRKQNNSFRNAVDRSLTLGSEAAASVDPSGRPEARSRSTSRVPFDQPVPATSSSTSRLHPVTDSPSSLLPSVNRASDAHFPARSTPAEALAPPVPARAHIADSVKPPKRSFGGIRGLFKFVSGKSSQTDKSTADRSGKSISVPLQRRLSVPEYRFPSSSTNTMTITSPTSRTTNMTSMYTSSKPGPMQIPFRDTYYVLRSPPKSNEAVVNGSAPVPPRVSDSPSVVKPPRTHSHITPQPKATQHPMHRVAEWQANLPTSPRSNDSMVPTPPVPPRPHRTSQQTPVNSSSKSVRPQEPITPRQNGHKSSSAHQHRSGRSNPDAVRSPGTHPAGVLSPDPRAFPQTISAYPFASATPSGKRSVDPPNSGRSHSHRSPRHTVPVSSPNPGRVYEDNRLQHVTQRRPDSHSVRTRSDSTKHPTSPSKRPHSALTSTAVATKSIAASPSYSATASAHASSRSRRRAVDPNNARVDAPPVNWNARSSVTSPSESRQTNQFANNSDHHRRRKSPSRNGQ